MSSLLNCWGICAKPMPEPPENKYNETKVAPQQAKHARVLSTMHINKGKVVITQTTITDKEADKMFGRTPDKTAETAKVRFADTVKE